MKTTVYRIQNHIGRGPFQPGFSHKWADNDFTGGCKAHPTWMEEFGEHLITKRGRPGEHFGSAVRSLGKLCEWFSPTERAKLSAFGFHCVMLDADRILAESLNQLVFARKLPLHWGGVIIPMPTEAIPETQG